MTATSDKPEHAVLYCRISSDPNELAAGVADQEADLRKLAAKLGWGVGSVVVENDTTAFKRKRITLPDGRRALRVVRPGWRQMLDDLSSGRADGLLAVDLDRACRDPRDLEDLIDTVEDKLPRVPVQSLTGSLSLATDADVTMARVMVAIANKSSRDTSRRVARARLRLASEGRPGGGPRPYGHNKDGTIRPDEAEVVVAAAERLLAGVSLAGVVRDLNERGVPAMRGRRWSTQTIRGVLLSPRVAGVMSLNGELLEDAPAYWQPIVDRSTWEAVVALLGNSNRKLGPGPTPKHLLSGLARCGHPDHSDDARPTMIRAYNGGNDKDGVKRRLPAYVCSERRHLTISAPALDDYVEAVVVERLSRPDAVELLTVRPEVDTAKLAAEANGLRTRIANLGDLVETGDMSSSEYRQRKGRLVEKLAKVEATMADSAGVSPLAGIAGRADAGQVWDRFDLGRKKAVIAALMTVTVLPAPGRSPRVPVRDRVQLD
ncbi:MAG: recombinase family protein [Acidimicrobiaceae bacterium]|nr:recombinase family protein [Acidimicrobiaceae bacterium]